MNQFIKLTRVIDWKVDAEKKKRTATETQTVYIRPSEITQFSCDGEYTYVTFGDSSITVTEKADEIYKMVSEEKNEQTELNDPYKVIPYPIYYEHTPSWWETDWWKNPIISLQTSGESIYKNSPYYTTTVIYTNGEIWE